MADYLYGSARIRVLENALIGKDRMEILLQTKTLSELMGRLKEFGFEWKTDPASGAVLREETLLSRLREAYREVLSLCDNDPALKLWLYPYDCNNLKVAIKCFFRQIDPIPMTFDFGTVSAEQIVKMVETRAFTDLPEAMTAAAEEAMAEYSKTRNPQLVDLILDRACYRDMLAAAETSGSAFVKALLQKKIDLTNLMICVRILRMQSGEAGKMLLRDALLEGGTLAQDQLLDWFEGGESFLWDRLAYSSYDRLARTVSESDKSLTAVERSMDDAWMEEIRTARYVPYGAEVLVAYLLAYEAEVRNLRILLAGKEAELPTQIIRERIRESYV